MKVIFLDIDGVLNVIPQGHDEFGAIFHQHFVDNLEKLVIETDAKIVISSTWRFSGLEEMQRMWKQRNLPGEVIDITNRVYRDLSRGYDIKEWLDKNPVDNYVILDDNDDMLEEQLQNFVQTSNNKNHSDCVDIGYGLTDICTDKAIKILTNYTTR